MSFVVDTLNELRKLKADRAKLLAVLEEIASMGQETNYISIIDALKMRNIARAAIAKAKSGKDE